MQQQVVEFLTAIRGGQLLTELYEALQTAIAGEQRTGKPSSLTVKFTISPATSGARTDDKADSSPVFVDASIETRIPTLKRQASIFFVTGDDSLLSRRDPRQSELPGLRPLDAPVRPASTDIAVGGER